MGVISAWTWRAPGISSGVLTGRVPEFTERREGDGEDENWMEDRGVRWKGCDGVGKFDVTGEGLSVVG
jgi:hypothetical protein